MNQLLQRAFDEAADLPREEQDRFALFLLAELESERRWAELCARPESEDALERLAHEALSEHRSRRTHPHAMHASKRTLSQTSDDAGGCPRRGPRHLI